MCCCCCSSILTGDLSLISPLGGWRRRRRRRVIWSHNLLEIYPTEINSISSHTQPVAQLVSLAPATFRVGVILPRARRAGPTAGPIKLSTTKSQIFNQAADLSPKPHSAKHRVVFFSLLSLLPLRVMAEAQRWFTSFAKASHNIRHVNTVTASRQNNATTMQLLQTFRNS